MNSHPLPRAILLDLDDTIVALSASADPYWRQVCERFSEQVEGLTPQALFDALKESRAGSGRIRSDTNGDGWTLRLRGERSLRTLSVGWA